MSFLIVAMDPLVLKFPHDHPMFPNFQDEFVLPPQPISLPMLFIGVCKASDASPDTHLAYPTKHWQIDH
jgi:hypothetical protein